MEERRNPENNLEGLLESKGGEYVMKEWERNSPTIKQELEPIIVQPDTEAVNNIQLCRAVGNSITITTGNSTSLSHNTLPTAMLTPNVQAGYMGQLQGPPGIVDGTRYREMGTRYQSERAGRVLEKRNVAELLRQCYELPSYVPHMSILTAELDQLRQGCRGDYTRNPTTTQLDHEEWSRRMGLQRAQLQMENDSRIMWENYKSDVEPSNTSPITRLSTEQNGRPTRRLKPAIMKGDGHPWVPRPVTADEDARLKQVVVDMTKAQLTSHNVPNQPSLLCPTESTLSRAYWAYQRNQAWIWLWLLYGMLICSADSQSVSRANHGVVFRDIQEISLVTQLFNHDFVIELPAYPTEPKNITKNESIPVTSNKKFEKRSLNGAYKTVTSPKPRMLPRPTKKPSRRLVNFIKYQNFLRSSKALVGQWLNDSNMTYEAMVEELSFNATDLGTYGPRSAASMHKHMLDPNRWMFESDDENDVNLTAQSTMIPWNESFTASVSNLTEILNDTLEMSIADIHEDDVAKVETLAHIASDGSIVFIDKPISRTLKSIGINLGWSDVYRARKAETDAAVKPIVNKELGVLTTQPTATRPIVAEATRAKPLVHVERASDGTVWVNLITQKPYGDERPVDARTYRRMFDILTSRQEECADQPQTEGAFHPRGGPVGGFDVLRALLADAQTSNKKDQDEIQGLIQAIHDVLPEEYRWDEIRGRRGLFDGVGKAAKWLFGTSTTDDQKAINQRMDTMIGLVKKSGAVYSKTLDNLVAGEKILGERVSNVITMMHEAANSTMAYMEESEARLEHRLTQLTEVLRRVLMLKDDTTRMIRKLRDMYVGAQMLSTGVIPLQLVPMESRQKIWDVITHELHDSDEFRMFHPVARSAKELFDRPKFHYWRIMDHLVISMQVPLTHYPVPWRLFEVQKFPVVIHGQPNVSTVLDDDTDFIATNADRSKFVTLTHSEVSLMQMNHGHVVSKRVVSSSEGNCLMNILLDDKAAIKLHCRYSVVHTVQPRITPLVDSKFYLQNIPSYELICVTRDGQVERVGCRNNNCGITYRQTFVCREHCVVDLENPVLTEMSVSKRPQGRKPICSIHTDTIDVTPMRAESRTRGKSNNTQGYLINLAVVGNLFSPAELRRIQGDTLLSDFPLIELPRLHTGIKFSDESIATDRKLRVSLNKVLNASTQSGKLYYTHTDELWDNLRSSGQDDWSVIMVLVLSGVVGAMLIAMIGMVYKLRSFAIALLVLQGQANAFELRYTLTPGPNTGGEVLQGTVHKQIVAGSNEFWPYVACFLLFCLVLSKLCKKAYAVMKTKVSTNVSHSDLVLNVHTGRESVFVAIQSIEGNPDQLTFEGGDFILIKRIHGVVWPYLDIKCRGHVFNKHKCTTFAIKQHVPLSWLDARKLRPVVCVPHRVYVAFLQNGVLTYLTEISTRKGGNGIMSGSRLTLTPSAPDLSAIEKGYYLGGEVSTDDEASIEKTPCEPHIPTPAPRKESRRATSVVTQPKL